MDCIHAVPLGRPCEICEQIALMDVAGAPIPEDLLERDVVPLVYDDELPPEACP